MTVKVEEKMILLSMENIQKKFFGKYANKNVHLQVEKGKILALLGENGAGKTTLMNILYGLYQPDGGKIFWHGEEVKFESPKDAIERKIGMVHQHFMLVPTLNVSQNITLGLKETGYPLTDRKAVNRKIKSLSDQYGLIVDPEAMVSDLSVGEQQRVEIMKLLYRDTELLILDEPTAVLTRQETIGLFEVLKRLSQDGRSVILITHKIPEVMEIADMVTVMRDAESIITVPITEVDEASLAEYMIGRPLNIVEIPSRIEKHDQGFILRNLNLEEKSQTKSATVSFEIEAGEILGIAGVEGNGQKELAESILGIRHNVAEEMQLFGKDLRNHSVSDRRDAGIAYISDDRHRDGLLLDAGFMDNMLLKFHKDRRYQNNGILNKKKLNDFINRQIKAYKIKVSSPSLPVRFLSGGNQQKLILSRELCDEPKLIVACQPTRGLDIGATEFVREQLLMHRSKGACILLISADLEEILSLSDRIAVLYKGRIMGILNNSKNIDITRIGLMMAGRNFNLNEVEIHEK